MSAFSGQPEFLVFLDFDGVLHPVRANEHERFKPEAIYFVNRILDALNAKIVLSTAWRMDSDIEKFNAWFKGRIIGSTPIHELDLTAQHVRFKEAMNFLTDKKWLHVPWVAIDDKRIHFPESSPAFITDAKVGITSNDADNIILIGRSMKFAQQSLLDAINQRSSV